jgi:hypothetical protein
MDSENRVIRRSATEKGVYEDSEICSLALFFPSAIVVFSCPRTSLSAVEREIFCASRKLDQAPPRPGRDSTDLSW